MEQYSVIVEGIERITNSITYHKIIEKLYLGETSEPLDQLKECLIALYGGILSFLIKAKKFYGTSTASKL